MSGILSQMQNIGRVESSGIEFNSPIGEGVLVFFEKDGAALNDFEGRIAMVSSKDTRTGPRHVRWLKQIDVVRIAD